MVIRRDQEGSGSICIPQAQHASVAGQMARAWGNIDFPVPNPQQAVCLAAERHDDGMESFDSSPERDPETGLPRDFMKMPLETWIDCWRDGPRRVGADNAYAGALVSMHGLYLLGYREIDPNDSASQQLVEDYREEQETLRSALLETAAEVPACEPYLSDQVLAANQRLLAALDAMSLAVCVPRLPATIDGVPQERGELSIRMEPVGALGSDQHVIEVEPWPFSPESVPLVVTGRRLDGPAGDQGALEAALAAAPLETMNFNLVKPGGSDSAERSRRSELPI